MEQNKPQTNISKKLTHEELELVKEIDNLTDQMNALEGEYSQELVGLSQTKGFDIDSKKTDDMLTEISNKYARRFNDLEDSINLLEKKLTRLDSTKWKE